MKSHFEYYERTRTHLWLANCYFAHNSSGVPVLLRFCDA